MKILIVATTLAVAPLAAFAGCKGHLDQTVASCPTGQVWDADTSSCTDAVSS